MAGFTSAYEKTLLDYGFPTSGATDYIAYSANGTSESNVLARTSVGATGWSAASGGAPSIKANANALTTATAGNSPAPGTAITHYSIWTASTGGTQKTDWQLLDAPRTLINGDVLNIAAAALKVTLD